MIVLKIVAITIIAILLSLPVQYLKFPQLDRETGKNRIDFGEIILWLIIAIVGSIILGWQFWSDVEREIWYFYLVPMVCPIVIQIIVAILDLQKRLLPVVLPILAIALIGCVILPIRDAGIVYEPEVSNSETIVETRKPLLSETELKARLNAVSISVPSYDSGAYIYEINKGEESGYGLALVTSEHMEFIPCKYQNQTSGIVRENYPKEEIVQIGIQLQTENKKTIPYAKFGILKRPHIFSKPEIDFYVLLNMQSGKITKQSD